MINSSNALPWCLPCMSYLNPSLRYPALSKYHSDSGCIHLLSHGRLMMKLASDGCDIFGSQEGESVVCNGCRNQVLMYCFGWLKERLRMVHGSTRKAFAGARKRRPRPLCSSFTCYWSGSCSCTTHEHCQYSRANWFDIRLGRVGRLVWTALAWSALFVERMEK